MDLLINTFAFLFGAVVGSFLNVCIYRLPRRLSVVSPPSHCPKCQAPVAWFDNLPLVSFLTLRGKCRKCRAPIPFRYFLVELTSALLWLVLWIAYGPSWLFAVSILFFSLLFIAIITDLETGLIPDKLNVFGMASGLALGAFFPGAFAETLWFRGLIASGLGLLVGGGILLATGVIGTWAFKKDSMGGGDVKLLAMIGSFLGWKSVILVFFTAPFLALPVALYSRFLKKEETIPYGPFLAFAAIFHFFYGRLVWNFLVLGTVLKN